jgi:uncharacterized metal-binding protein
MQCAACNAKDCYQGKDCTRIKNKVKKEYQEKFNKKIMEIASRIEAQHYMKLTRLEELITFCQEMGFTRVGIAFCIGLEEEAKLLARVLKRHVKVFSVCCKVCGIDKTDFNLQKIKRDRYEATCNPIGQAMVLNNNATDLNVIFGLCLGHDLLFTKFSQAPVTTLAVKDRVLAHNPIGALTSRYYQRKIFQP